MKVLGSKSIGIIISWWFIIIGIINTSCEHDVGPIILDSGNSGPVSYQGDIQPIFNASCIGCHDEFHQFIDLRSCCSYDQLWTGGAGAPYVNTENPEQSKLYRHLTGDLPLMPVFGSLPDREIELVLKWIEEGGINN